MKKAIKTFNNMNNYIINSFDYEYSNGIVEGINNVIKHAKSNKMLVKIEDEFNSININIMDYGIGFNAKNRNDGSGLANIKNRAQIINAEFNIKSTENLGTEITISYKKPTQWTESKSQS